MFAVRLIKRLTKSVVRRMSQGDNSPSINHGSFIMLFSDSLSFVWKSEPGLNQCPFVFYTWRGLWQSSSSCTVYNHNFCQTMTSKPPSLRYKELGGEERENIFSISLIPVLPFLERKERVEGCVICEGEDYSVG